MSDITFSDVMFEPQYSEVRSRKMVDLSSSLGKTYLRVPLISANMKDITGIKMIAEMARCGSMGILHRFMPIEENVDAFYEALDGVRAACPAFSEDGAVWHTGVSVGVKEEEKERFVKLLEAGAKLFCIDVAHGHSILVAEMIKYMRSYKSKRPKDIYIIAGNIATARAAADLDLWGADALKVGIGPGCFVAGTIVFTSNGPKNIEDVHNGDFVYTHTGDLKRVINTIKYNTSESLIKVNDIVCTKRHEFYVIEKKDSGLVNEDNIGRFAKWIKAEDLDDRYLMVQMSN